MAEERIREIAELIRHFLKGRKIRVEKIIVFGSYAKGSYKNDSDVDIAIISKDFEGKDVFRKARMLNGLEWFLIERFRVPLDIVAISPKELHRSSSIIAEFVRTGRAIT